MPDKNNTKNCKLDDKHNFLFNGSIIEKSKLTINWSPKNYWCEIGTILNDFAQESYRVDSKKWNSNWSSAKNNKDWTYNGFQVDVANWCTAWLSCANLNRIPNWSFPVTLWLAGALRLDIWLAEGAIEWASIWKPSLVKWLILSDIVWLNFRVRVKKSFKPV